MTTGTCHDRPIRRPAPWSPAASSGQQRLRVLTGIKAPRRAPPPLLGADGFDAGAAHVRPDRPLTTMPSQKIPFRMTPCRATVDTSARPGRAVACWLLRPRCGPAVLPRQPATPNTPASSTQIRRSGRITTPTGHRDRNIFGAQGNESRPTGERERRDRDEKITPNKRSSGSGESGGEVARAEPRPRPRQAVTTLHVTNHGPVTPGVTPPVTLFYL